MRLDEALLEAVRETTNPVFIVRTYEWAVPTLSLGVNQSVQDIDALLQRYQGVDGNLPTVVRRSTGGRAILHGQDISYAFITNIPAIVRQDVCSSYRLLNGFIRQTLIDLGIPIRDIADSAKQTPAPESYTRSPVCFETKTTSDLVTPEGKKLAGSAQLRRHGGLLQHGSAFLTPYTISGPVFSQRLFTLLEATLKQPLLPLNTSEFLRSMTTFQGAQRASGVSLNFLLR